MASAPSTLLSLPPLLHQSVLTSTTYDPPCDGSDCNFNGICDGTKSNFVCVCNVGYYGDRCYPYGGNTVYTPPAPPVYIAPPPPPPPIYVSPPPQPQPPQPQVIYVQHPMPHPLHRQSPHPIYMPVPVVVHRNNNEYRRNNDAYSYRNYHKRKYWSCTSSLDCSSNGSCINGLVRCDSVIADQISNGYSICVCLSGWTGSNCATSSSPPMAHLRISYNGAQRTSPIGWRVGNSIISRTKTGDIDQFLIKWLRLWRPRCVLIKEMHLMNGFESTLIKRYDLWTMFASF